MDSNRNLEIGWLIPLETTLAIEFGCARATANRHLRELAQEGFLERRRKAGTRVVMPVGRSANFEIPRIRLEIEETGATYRYALLLLEVTVQFDFRWRNLKSIPEAEQEKFEEVNPNEWQVNNVPWTHADHILSATNADVEKAELLSLAERDALFVIQRRTWSKENLVTYVRLYYPGLFYEKERLVFQRKYFVKVWRFFSLDSLFRGNPGGIVHRLFLT